MKSLEEIQKTIESLAFQLEVPAYLLPVYGKPELGKIDIQIQNDKYIYVHRPRYVNTSVEDELLFAVFAEIANHMGLLFAIENKSNKDDPRRTAHPYQLALLEKLKPEWRKRREVEIEEELRSFPYNDHYDE